MNPARQKKIAALLQKELATLFLHEGQSRYHSMITVTKATVTKDLSIARAYLSIYLVQDKEAVLDAIRANVKDIRFRLGQHLRNQLRIIPQLEFFIDDTLDYMERIEQLLKREF